MPKSVAAKLIPRLFTTQPSSGGADHVGALLYRTSGIRGIHVDNGTDVVSMAMRIANAREFGVRADVRSVTNAAITSGDATLTSASGAFTSADVGKVAVVAGAGAAGVDLITTIASVTSGTEVELATTAGTTVAGAGAHFGTDDAAALGTMASTVASGTKCVIPDGRMFVSTWLITKAIHLAGATSGGTFLIPFNNQDCIRINTETMLASGKVFNFTMSDIGVMPLRDQTAGVALRVGNIGYATFHRVLVSDALGGKPYTGIRIDAASDTRFDEVIVTDCVQDNILINPPSVSGTVGKTLTVTWADNCGSFGAGRYGMYMLMNQTYGTSEPDGTLEGYNLGRMHLYGNASAGLRIEATSSPVGRIRNIQMDGTTFDSTSAGPGLETAGAGVIENLVLSNIWASNNGTHGIYFGSNVIDVIMGGSCVMLNGEDGIELDGATRIMLHGIYIWDNSQDTTATYYGLNITGAARYIQIAAVRITNTGKSTPKQNGWAVGASVQDVDFEGYIDTGAATTPQSINASAARIRWNTVADTTGASIRRFGGAVDIAQLAADPSAPPTGFTTLYLKSGGVFFIPAGGSATQLAPTYQPTLTNPSMTLAVFASENYHYHQATPTGPSVGLSLFYAKANGFGAYIGGRNEAILGYDALSAIVAAVTVSNTVTETSLGTVAIPANLLVVGSTVRITADGVAGTHSTGTVTLTFRVRIGATGSVTSGNIVTSIVVTEATSQTNKPWRVEIQFTVRTAGAAGTVIGNGFCWNELSTTAPNYAKGSGTTATVAIDTTVARDMALTVQHGNNNANNTVTVHNLTYSVDKLG